VREERIEWVGMFARQSKGYVASPPCTASLARVAADFVREASDLSAIAETGREVRQLRWG